MPSLNLTKRELTYTAADQRALERCEVLLNAMAEYDRASRDDAKEARRLIASLWAHVNKSRNGAPKPKQEPVTT